MVGLQVTVGAGMVWDSVPDCGAPSVH
uniref:Uncharacterized protein n=1 Tax=Anguilla anguilla TaxID=7936 RepID=A0A0E9T6X6_ANGAN